MSSTPDISPSQRTYPLLSRDEIRQLIAKGAKIIIVDQYVLKVDAWIQYHPGGDLVMLHMVGRDATDEVKVLVCPQDAAQRASGSRRSSLMLD
jgi:delta8-fatty-acid desaturase